MLTCNPKSIRTPQLPVVLDARVVTDAGGGPDKTILNSPRFFAQAGYRMLCAYMHPPGDQGFEQLRSRALAWKAPLLSVPDCGPWDWRVVTRLVTICRRERVQIWHGHDYKSNALGLVIRQFWPMHLVTTVHGWVTETRRTPLYYAIDKRCLPHYESVICVSADLHERCLSIGVPDKRCVLIENGIDTDQYQRRLSTRDAKKRLGMPAERQVIGAVGRLSPEKGFDHLLRAVAQLVGRGLDLVVVVVGDGPERTRLESLGAQLGITDRLHLVGYQADPRTFFEAMDVFALSSLREGLPNVLLEAMAMEVPVVATRIAGVPDVVTDQQNGMLVAPGSDEELAGALDRLLRDDQLRAGFQDSARRTVEGRFSFANRIQRIRRIYDALLDQPRPLNTSAC